MGSTKSGQIGQRPIEEHVVYQQGEWWYTGQSDGRRRLTSHRRKNHTRMFVSGKYIPKSHPLHQPGVFKNWDDAHSHTKLDSTKEGFVYLVTNPAWAGWVKCGKALDATDRCKSYNTGSPYRDYNILYTVAVGNRHRAEKVILKKLKKFATDVRGEWFKMTNTEAKRVVKSIPKRNYSEA